MTQHSQTVLKFLQFTPPEQQAMCLINVVILREYVGPWLGYEADVNLITHAVGFGTTLCTKM
jgi:hypothetical protein